MSKSSERCERIETKERMSELFRKVVYGTVLLAAIMHTPKYSVLIALDPDRTYHLHAVFKGFGKSILLALVLTLMALLPTREEFRGVIRPCKNLFVLLLMPWVCTCCLMFLINSVLLIKITHMSMSGNSWNCFVKAFLLYCTLFGLATETMLHWYSIYYLRLRSLHRVEIHM